MKDALLESQLMRIDWLVFSTVKLPKIIFYILSIYSSFFASGVQRADFWNEACNLAGLHHPNVVSFYGIVQDGPGEPIATVTEYMVNGSLRNALQRNFKYVSKFCNYQNLLK